MKCVILAAGLGSRLRAQSDAVDVLRALGADPVNMPMAEVYSAMAKGVIDGVVAPADTIRSLHFSEVGRYFTGVQFPRGAYPARAISSARFSQLPPHIQRLRLALLPIPDRDFETAGLQPASDGAAHLSCPEHRYPGHSLSPCRAGG